MAQNNWKPLLALLLIILFADLFYSLTWQQGGDLVASVSYSRFKKELAGDNVKNITLKGNLINGEFRGKTAIAPSVVGGKGRESTTFTTIKPLMDDPGLLADLEGHKVEVTALSTENSPWSTLFISLLPWLIILGVWLFALRGMKSQGAGGVLGGFAKSGAREYAPEKVSVTWRGWRMPSRSYEKSSTT